MTVTGDPLALSLNSKVVVDALYKLPPYRQRLPSQVSNAANLVLSSVSANRRVLEGIHVY